MANRLTMAEKQSIQTLHESGHSNRQIAKLLGVDRETVGIYVRAADNQIPPNAPSGSENDGAVGEAVQTPPNAPSGLEFSERGSECRTDPEPGARGTRSRRSRRLATSGPASACEPFRQVIEEKLAAGLTARRIHDDLVSEHQFPEQYWSVRRYVEKLKRRMELPFRRLETPAGEEIQVDFGVGAWVVDLEGKRRRPWVFRVVLSHSRKGYTEAVWRQTTDAFMECLENAFRAFGGVPKRIVLDNLKAAVLEADWYDPEVHPRLRAFAAHYGTVFLPTKPYTPRHKGKVESGVKYVKQNALAGRTFSTLAAENEHLLEWEQRVADTRIHGTTKRQVREVFENHERPALLPLPAERFPSFKEGRRVVHRDGYVEVDKGYYSAPPEYVGRDVWVRWDGRVVRLFDDRWEPLIVHAKTEPGRFRTAPEHIPREKFSAVERGADALLRQLAKIGPHTRQWAEATVQARGVEAVRVLVGLKALAGRHTSAALERACEAALSYGAYRLRTVRELLKRQGPLQQQFEFTQAHPVIRPLSEYSLTSLFEFRRDRDGLS